MTEATVKLTLDTKEFLAEASKVAGKLSSALSIDPKGNQEIKDFKKELRDISKLNATSAKEKEAQFKAYLEKLDEVEAKEKRLAEVREEIQTQTKTRDDAKRDYEKVSAQKLTGKATDDDVKTAKEELNKQEEALTALRSERNKLNAEVREGNTQLAGAVSIAQEFLDEQQKSVALVESRVNEEGKYVGAQQQATDAVEQTATSAQQIASAEEKATNSVQQFIDAESQATGEVNATSDALNNLSQSAEDAKTSTTGIDEGIKDVTTASEEASRAVGSIGAGADTQSVEIIENLDEVLENLGSNATETQWIFSKFFTAFSSGVGNLISYWTVLSDKWYTSLGGITTKWTDVYTALTNVKSGMISLQDAFAFVTANKNVGALYKRLMDLKTAKRQLEETGLANSGDQQKYAAIMSEIDRTKEAIKSYKQETKSTASTHETAKKAGVAFAKSVSSAVNALKKSMKGVGNLIKNVVKTFKSGFSAISKAVGRVRSSFNGMASSMRSNFKHMITSLTKYVLGFRSLFFLVRRLRKYIGEGIQNMAQFNDGNNHVNEGITNLLSSLLFLKNAWATAFSPIIQFVQGWLVGLIDTLAEVGNAISRFIGSLLGTGTVFQAVKVDAQDYADSLGNVGGSAGGAADKTKKLTDRLAAFDDLNVLGKDNDPDSTGSGGGGGAGEVYTPDPNEMFKLVDVNQDILDKLKEMWDSADFSELGEKFRDGLIDAFDKIDWNEIKKTVYRIGKSIVTFLNGVFSDSSLWDEAGTALAEGINTALTFLYSILSNGDIDIGGNLATFISSAFNNLDADTIAFNLELLAQGIVDNINSFFENLELGDNVGSLSQSLTEFFVTIFTGIDLQTIIDTLAPIGTAILDGIASGLLASDNPIAVTLGEVLSNISTAIQENDPAAIASAITTLLTSALGSIDWGAIMSVFVGLGDAILGGIQEGLSSSNDPVFQAIGEMIGSLRDALPTLLPVLAQVFDVLLQLITAVLPVIVSLLPVITDLITLVAPILQLIADVIEMISPFLADLVSAILPVLQSIIATLLPYIQQIIEAILPVFLQLLEQLQPVFDTLISAILPVIVHLLDALMPIIQIILGCISELIGPIMQILPPILELIGTILPPLIDLLAPIIKLIAMVIDLVVAILSPILELIAPLIEMLTACLSPIFEVLGFIGDLIEAIIIPIFGSLSGVIQGVVVPILKFLVTAIKVVMDIITDLGNVFKGVVDFFREGAQEMGRVFKDLVNKLLDGVEGFINFFVNGINEMIDDLNEFSVDVPDEVPVIGGLKFGFNLSRLNTVNIPRLAQGAVIPPNKEFMAVLGDQSHGTNIEAPLDTIKQAVAEVLANNNNQEVIDLLQQLIRVVESKNLTIGDKEIGKANARYTNQQRMIRGTTF